MWEYLPACTHQPQPGVGECHGHQYLKTLAREQERAATTSTGPVQPRSKVVLQPPDFSDFSTAAGGAPLWHSMSGLACLCSKLSGDCNNGVRRHLCLWGTFPPSPSTLYFRFTNDSLSCIVLALGTYQTKDCNFAKYGSE